MTPAATPTVTVAIPLHRSAQFVDVVLANIAAIDIDDAEIIVSDRTMVDDATAQVAAATADDPRVSVVAEPAGLSWTAHHRLLLHEARGRLFMWMPHDDDFPVGHVRALVHALGSAPGAVVAFGDLIWGFPDGRALGPPPVRLDGARWRAVDAARFFTYGTIGRTYRGVLDREAALAVGVVPRDLPDNSAWADERFMLELMLLGRPVFVPGVASTKRLHDESTHDRWRATPLRTLHFHLRVMACVVRRGRDRTTPLALALVARHWLASVTSHRRSPRRVRPHRASRSR